MLLQGMRRECKEEMNTSYAIKFERFEDLFRFICREMERLENLGEEPDGGGDEGFNEWLKEQLSADTKDRMLTGEWSGCSPSFYAEVLNESYEYCQACPDVSFDAAFRDRMERRVQIEARMKIKGLS